MTAATSAATFSENIFFAFYPSACSCAGCNIEELFRGTIDGCSVHPREVVKAALTANAAAVVFAHNHPSGVAEPSRADTQLTKRLTDALGLVDVRVLDHIVVGGSETVSFAERGLI